MKVHVFVGVHMVERQTACAERCKLRPNLARELSANAWKSKKSHTGAGHVPVELALLADKVRDLHRGQNGMPVSKVQVQADSKLGQTAGARHRIGRRLTSNHQARGGQNSVPMRLFNCLVNGWVETEIVGADDQSPQLAISRLRRN